MKNEIMMAGLLTLTAGAASQIVIPSYAQAANKLSEQKFAKNILVQIAGQARYTDYDGKTYLGHIYLDLIQERMTPEFPNKLHAEMRGFFYFESDTEDAVDYKGQPTKTMVPLIGVDGDILLDKVNSDEYRGNTYSLYGCSSTSTCETGGFSLDFKDGQVTISGTFSQYDKVELLVETFNHETQQKEMTWQKEIWGAQTVVLKD